MIVLKKIFRPLSTSKRTERMRGGNSNGIIYRMPIVFSLKSNTMRFFTAMLVLTGFCISLNAQKYSNEFLTLPAGARAQAMGGAVIANGNNVYSGFLNPAGLAAMEDTSQVQLGAMHAEWFAGVGKYDYLGATLPVFNGGRRLGLSMMRFGIDGIPNTLSLYNDDGTFSYDNITEFSAADYAFLFSYAQPLNVKKGKLLLGANAKVIYREIGSFARSWGFGLDAGLQYHLNSWRFGLMAKDITSTFNAWSFSLTDQEKETLEVTGNELPINSVEITRPQLILGTAWMKRWKNIGLLTELDAIISTDGQRNVLLSGDPFSLTPALGLELDYQQFIFFRLGANNLQQEVDFDDQFWTFQPNLGVGLKILNFHLDYAFTDIGDTANQTFSHVVSLRLGIRGKR
jgi:hypothetical protein